MIVGKSVVKVLKEDIIEACGPFQTCSGVPAGIKAAVHSMAESFNKEESEGMLLVDAQNALTP